MLDWQWIIYGLPIIFLIFLFCLYRNNFYLWRYLVKFNIIFKKTELKIKDKRKKLNILFFCIPILCLVLIIIFLAFIFFIVLKFRMYVYLPMIFLLIIILIILCTKKEGKNKLSCCSEILKEIIILILLCFCGIKILDWFQKFNYALFYLFSEFLILIWIIYVLKIWILNISEPKKIILSISFIICFLGLMLGSNVNSEVGIRLTKGNLRDLDGKTIELFFESKKLPFQIHNDKDKYYVDYQLSEKEKECIKGIEKTKILFNKDNNLSLFKNKDTSSKKGKFIVFNNDNSRIIDNNGKIIDNAEVAIKVVTFENTDNTNTIYIFVNNGWWLLNNKDKIYIEEDNIYLNFINLILFLFGITYFGLKLYSKKSLQYYDKEIINKIRKTPILLDRNKYDKFLTLSMFGLTIPNIWKIVTTKSIEEMNSSIWTKADLIIYVVPFSILLFCVITSKEISECVKELEKENDKNEEILNYNTKEIEKLENIEHKLDNLIFSRNKKTKNKRSGKIKKR